MAAVPRDVLIVGSELVIVWEDGREDYIALEKLRRACPCAMCRGERDILGNLYKGPERPLHAGLLPDGRVAARGRLCPADRLDTRYRLR